MDQQEFDKLLQLKISGYSSGLPADGWNRIDKELRPKKRRGLWFWLVPGIFILAGILFVADRNPFFQKPLIKNTQAFSITIDSNATTQSLTPIASTKESIVANSNSNQTILQTNTLSQVLTPNKKSNTHIIIHTKKIRPVNLSPDHVTYSHVNLLSNQKPVIAPYLSFQKVGSPFYSMHFEKLNSLQPIHTDRDPTLGCPPVQVSSTRNWFIEGGIGPLYGLKNASNPSDPFLISGNPFSKLSFNAQIMAGKKLGDRFSLKGGLLYLYVREKPIHDSSGQETRYNTYRSWNIPILLGYEVGTGRARVTFNAGPVINISSAFRGNVIDPSGVVNIRNINWYRKTTGINAYGGFSLHYLLSPHWQLAADPYFIYQFSNMARPNNGLTEKVHVAGAVIGLRYSFLKKTY